MASWRNTPLHMSKHGVGHVRKWWVKEQVAHLQMVTHQEVFCEVVSFVLTSLCPVKVELPLGNPILDPVILHIKSLGALHVDLGFQDIVCRGIVGLNGGAVGWLWVTHFG